jgi:hypothetical protein
MRLSRRPTPSSRWAVFAAGLLAMAVWPGPAVAQPRPQPKTLSAEDGKGTVDAVMPGMIRLRLKGGEFWNVVPAPNARVSVVGTAAREMLQPGQFVSCSLMLDEFGKVAAPAAQITFPGGGLPGVVAGGLGLAEPGAKRVPGKREAGTYLVSGPIKLVADDVVTVQAGRDRFEITVPPETELLVKTTNYTLATPGDEVEVEGLYIQKGQLQATTLSITLANPLTPPTKNRGSKRPAK